MVAHLDYVAGWLESSVHDILRALPADAASLKFSLITCLDSNGDPASLHAKDG